MFSNRNMLMLQFKLNNSARTHSSNKQMSRKKRLKNLQPSNCRPRKKAVLLMLRNSRIKLLQKTKLRRRKTPKLQQLKPRKMRLSIRELLLPIKRSKSSKRKRTLWLSLPLRRWPLLRADAPRLPRKESNAGQPHNCLKLKLLKTQRMLESKSQMRFMKINKLNKLLSWSEHRMQLLVKTIWPISYPQSKVPLQTVRQRSQSKRCTNRQD